MLKVEFLLPNRLVTPHSVIELKILNKQTLKSDTLIGVAKIDLYSLLKVHNGVCEYSRTFFAFPIIKLKIFLLRNGLPAYLKLL